MPRIRKTLLALLAALLIGGACSQTPAATPRTDTSPVVTSPDASPDATGGETDDATETEDPSPSP